MIRNCPQCQARLDDFAFSCDHCGWSVVLESGNGTSVSKPAVATQPATLTIDSDPTPLQPEPEGLTQSAMDLPPMNVESRIQQAMDLIEREDYKTALMFLNRALVDAPTERVAECFSLRGYAHLKDLDFVRADDDCTAAISRNWDRAETFAWRAAARGEQNKWKMAFDDLDRACELAGAHRDPYLNLMESYAATASDYFRELVKSGNDSAELFFERGWIYFKSGNYAKAERDFRHALNSQPNHPWASLGMAELSMHHGETAGVLELCGVGELGDLECQRQSLRLRAKLQRKLGNIGLAKQDLSKLTRLAADNPQELVDCCRLRSSLGDNVMAIEGLTNLLDDSPEDHMAILVRGDCYREIRNYGLAINDYTTFLRYYPRDVKALIRRANVFLATKRFEAAHVDLDRVVDIDETEFEAYLLRSKIHLEEGQLDSALTECRRAVQLDNQQPEAFAVLAAIYNRLCDYGNAIEEFSRSIELAKATDEKAQYLYLRGIAYYELGDFEKSLKDFKKSCRLRPNFAGSWIWKAATCARVEKWTDAILGLQQAILVRPTAADQYQKLGRPVAEKAIEFFNRQQQRGHSKTELFRQRGMAFQFIGKDTEAIADYTTALNQVPEDVDTLIRRGQVYSRFGDNKSAIDDFTRVIQQERKNHRARYCRAISRLAENKYDEAKKDLLKAIQLDPENPGYHVLLGELLQKLGDEQGVIEAFDRAIMQDATNPVTFRRRAAAHLAVGQYLNAISDFTWSLELQPTQMDVLVQRGQTYLKSGQPIMALEDFELALTHNDRLAKAYSGRATALVSQGRHEYTLIWLTKAIHRFSEPRELSEIVFARGKVFYQMGRIAPAISDFTSVIDLMRGDNKTVAAARYARAIAEIHNEQYDDSERDFRKLAAMDPSNEHFRSAQKWLADRTTIRPRFLNGPEPAKRPTRPPVIRNGLHLKEQTCAKWQSVPPFDSWVVRTPDKKEYGPVHFGILNSWVEEGRIDIGMKLLRADWHKWKRVERILPEVTPLESTAGMIDEFPELDLGFTSTDLSSEDA